MHRSMEVARGLRSCIGGAKDEMTALESAQQMQHWQALLESAGEGIYGLSREGVCTYVNRMAISLFGFSTEEMVGSDMHVLVHHHRPDGREFPGEECAINSILSGGTPFRERLETMFRKDGGSFLAEVSAQPVLVEGEVFGVVVTVRDVSTLHEERAELERAYLEVEKRRAELDAVIESIPHGVYVARRDGGPMHLNRRAVALSGSTFPEQLKTMDLALRGESSSDVLEQDGRWLRSSAAPITLNGEIIGAVAVNSDVTQSRLQDEALRKSEKLAAVGQLASSIAHEINGPLESITNLLYLIQHANEMSEVQEYALLAQSELARVSEITLQTLRFHRQQSRASEIDIEHIARAVMNLYTGRLLVRGVRLVWKIRRAPRVFGMEGELRQVLNNLVRNALDAMGSNGGVLTIAINRETGPVGDGHGKGREGVRLTIADTGEGIDPKIADRLFEPFQTTKEHTGTGLGLWVSQGIVEKHGGRFRLRTRRGGKTCGTLFSIWLPIDGGATRSPAPD